MRGFPVVIIVLVVLYSVTPGPYRYYWLPVIFLVMCVFLFGRKEGKR